MLDALYQIFMGSLLLLATAFLWVIIVALVVAGAKQLRKK